MKRNTALLTTAVAAVVIAGLGLLARGSTGPVVPPDRDGPAQLAENQGDPPSAPHDGFVTANGIRLHYREWGSPAAPPLLVLHGLTGHAWEFDGVARELAGTFHVFAINQRGHGASEWADVYSPALMSEDVAAVITALGLQRVSLIGHSMGGVNGWWFAGRHPEMLDRFVILDIDPLAITSPLVRNTIRNALDGYAAGRYRTTEEAVADYLAGYEGPRANELRAFALNNLEQRSDSSWTWRFDARRLGQWMDAAAADQEAHWSRVRRITAPVLIVRAAQSPFTSAAGAERLARELPDARLVEIDAAGHDIHIDQHDALVRVLRSFLQSEAADDLP